MISRSSRSSVRGNLRLFSGIALFGLVAGGCTDFAGYDLDYVLARAPFVATLRNSVSFESQELPRLPAPGTVPVSSPNSEILPSFTALQLDSVGASLTSPMEATPEVLERGEFVYQNNCLVCHGAEGVGNGPVVGAGKYPLGPSLVSGTALNRSTGYVYGIIRVGRGLMPPYGERIAHEDRWAVALYVANLQGQTGGVPSTPPTVPAQVEVQPAANAGQ